MVQYSNWLTDTYGYEYLETGEQLKIYLDDEPLEYILYGEGESCRTMANLYLSGSMCIQKLTDARHQYDWELLNEAVEKLSNIKEHLSKDHYYRIIKTVDSFLPSCPNPQPYNFDADRLVVLMKQIWEYAESCNDKNLQNNAGHHLIRLYEYQKKYENALFISSQLLNNHKQAKETQKEASAFNNHGFILLTQQRWTEAIPLFERAVSLYRELKIDFNQANSLCNYWHCRFKLGDWGDIEETNYILELLIEKLEGSGEWHERKPLILHAQFEEYLGNYRRAMQWVIRAIRSARRSGTRYPEDDRIYLKKLSAEYKRRRNL